MRPLHPTGPVDDRLATIARTQIQRAPWPDFDAYDASRHPASLRRPSARQWWRRAREEYGSIHEFTQLAHVLTTLRAPVALLAGLSRLITDEARHATLAARMAEALWPEAPPADVFEWPPPSTPWDAPPADDAAKLAWVADALMTSCCLGETLSRPLFEALATVITEPVPEAVVRQILRDEHLHAAFGWEALGWTLARLDDGARDEIQRRLARRLAGFERSCAVGGLALEDLVGRELVVAPPGPDAPPNLGQLDPETYAMVFYATLEREILPRFDALGLDAMRAWRARPR
ncbi:MAG TPA: hypothetical protein RMH99_25350 [Sandaracinaceae bacterium LLY-WYZ-13_1]|nr:hypothetical protein [Sandaracinaceae bacterium LLY-WYZ-13_1]